MVYHIMAGVKQLDKVPRNATVLASSLQEWAHRHST